MSLILLIGAAVACGFAAAENMIYAFGYVIFEHRFNLLLLALLLAVQAADVGYGLKEARAANLPMR